MTSASFISYVEPTVGITSRWLTNENVTAQFAEIGQEGWGGCNADLLDTLNRQDVRSIGVQTRCTESQTHFPKSLGSRRR